MTTTTTTMTTARSSEEASRGAASAAEGGLRAESIRERACSSRGETATGAGHATLEEWNRRRGGGSTTPHVSPRVWSCDACISALASDRGGRRGRCASTWSRHWPLPRAHAQRLAPAPQAPVFDSTAVCEIVDLTLLRLGHTADAEAIRSGGHGRGRCPGRKEERPRVWSAVRQM